MHKFTFLATATTLIFLFSINNALAQQPELSDTVEYKELNEVIVENRYYKKYHESKTSNYLRLTKNNIEVPQNIQIITSQALQDQLIFSLNESASRNVSGTFREELHNGISPDIYSRGGYLSAMRNGVDLRPLIKGPAGDDIAIIENIEFIKGPSSFLQSVSDPAGAFNIMTKQANGDVFRKIRIGGGSFGLFRTEADISGKWKDSSNLFFRVNLMSQKKRGFIDYDHGNSSLFAPSIRYLINQKLSVAVDYIYQDMSYKLLSDAQISPHGYGSLDRKFTITDPASQPYRSRDHNLFLTLTYKLNKTLELTTVVSHIKSRYNGNIFWAYSLNQEDPDILNRYYVYDAANYSINSLQTYIRGKAQTGFFQHEFIGGIDFNQKIFSGTDTWETASTIYPLDLRNPRYANSINYNGQGGSFESENDINGINNKINSRLTYVSAFMTDRITWGKGKFSVNPSIRLTSYNGDFMTYGTASGKSDYQLTPRLGINYLLTKYLAIYALADRSFLPQSGLNADNQSMEAMKGTNLELGVKKEWLSGRLNSTLSVYHIKRKGTIVRDPVSNRAYQLGENISRGVELDLKGQLHKKVNIIVNYAFTDSYISKDDKNPDLVKKATPNAIRHIQNTWVNWNFWQLKSVGLSFSAGYQFMGGRSERFTSTNSTYLNDYFRTDAGIQLENKKLSMQLMINNLFDKHLYSTAWQRNGLYYWVQQAPRAFRWSIQYKF